MKFISTLAFAAALDVRDSKAPHQKLLQVGQDSLQYYENDAKDFVRSGYNWEVVGDVTLSGLVNTFINTGPAAQGIVNAVEAWGNSLRSSWNSTLMSTCMANNLTCFTTQATVGASTNYSSSDNYTNTTSYTNTSSYSNSSSNSSSSSSNSSNWQNPCNALNATGCCYGNATGDSHNSNGRYCHYNNQAQCLNNAYGGINYGCTWNVIQNSCANLTGSGCCYGNPLADKYNSKGRYCHYNNQGQCLSDSYGGVNYGCTWRNNTPVKLELVSASDSGVDPRWPWNATRLIEGRVQPNIADRATQTCTHSNFTAGNWQQVGLAGNATITTIKLMGRSDCCQSRQYGDKVYAGNTLCGTWPQGEADGWITFTCPAGTVASDVRVVQPHATALTICGVEVYGYAH